MATIRKRKDTGKWQAQIRLAGISPRTATFATKAKAKAWADTEERRLLSGEVAPTQKDVRKLNGMTLEDLTKLWYATVPFSLTRQSAYRALLGDPIAKLSLTQITKNEVEAWKRRRLAKLKPATLARYIGVPKQSWEYGIEVLELPLRNSPFEAVDISKAHSKRTRRLYLGEYERLVASCVPEARRNHVGIAIVENMPEIIEWAIETAMRREEITKIRADHFSQDGRFLQISETKTDVPRKIPLTKKAQEIARKRILKGFNNRLFPYHPTTISQMFHDVTLYAGIDDLHFHDLRHEALSRFNDMGLTPFDIKLISGHTDIKSLSIYIQTELERVAKSIGA